jgi:hypothetical protein
MSKTTDNGLKRAEKTRSNRLNLSDFLCLTPFSAIFQLNYLTTHTSLSPILHGFAPGLCKLQKGCTRLAAANAKAYQLLAHGGWFSQGTPG